jgi:hypothetical protein
MYRLKERSAEGTRKVEAGERAGIAREEISLTVSD